MVGTAGAIIGVVIGVWLYSPSRTYRFAGAPSRIPYRGWKRWHTVFGLIFGLATITYTFSGSLAFLPFPEPQRAQPAGAPQAPPRAAQARGGRRGGNPGLNAALRGRVDLADFSTRPRDLLSQLSDLPVKEIEFTSFAGRPLYRVNLGDSTSRLVSMDGKTVDGFDHDEIIAIVKRTGRDPEALETRLVHQYDVHYLDRTRRRPLPVILARLHDAEDTRYYIDPQTATVVQTASNRNFWRRWLYNGLHSLNFPWLYNYRPLWDIVVITFMLGGMALSATSLILAWRALGRRIRRLFGKRMPAIDDENTGASHAPQPVSAEY
jgi:hypothetical protein